MEAELCPVDRTPPRPAPSRLASPPISPSHQVGPMDVAGDSGTKAAGREKEGLTAEGLGIGSVAIVTCLQWWVRVVVVRGVTLAGLSRLSMAWTLPTVLLAVG